VFDLTVDFDFIPAPLAIFDSDFSPKSVNHAYRTTFGPQVLDAHRSWLEKHRSGDHISRLDCGDLLVSFDAETQSMRERAALSSQAMALSQVGAWRYHLLSGRLEFSPEIYQVFSFPPEQEINAQSFAPVFSKETLEILNKHCDATIQTGEEFHIELPFNSPLDGKCRWIRSIGRAEYADGVCIALSGAVQDITEKRETAESLAELVRKFGFAQQSSGFGVWDYHPESKVLHWDDALFALYDVDKTGFQAGFQDWANCVLPDDLAATVAQLQDAVRGNSEFDTEFRIVLKDGRIRWLKATAHATRDAEGRALRMVGFNYDITNIKKVEEELRASNVQLEASNHRLEELAASSMAASRAKSSFLANMSHEIRTPMNGVLGLTTVLLETELTPQQRDSVDIIRKSAEALLILINDLLDFSKVESGTVRLDPEEVDIRDAVDDLVEFLALEAQRKGLDFFYRVNANVPRLVKLDPGRLRQVLINLVGNAVKFTQEGSVTLLLDSEQGELLFKVRDTGPGIEPAEQCKIFEPFTRGKALTSAGGTGLGLAICKRLAVLMGGKLLMESRPGAGTSFLLKIPSIPVEQDHTSRPLQGMRVAITGGKPKERRTLLQNLRFLGAEVTDQQADIEILFQGATSVFPEAVRFLVVLACDAAKYADVTNQGFRGVVTRPFRRRPLESLLSSAHEAIAEVGDPRESVPTYTDRYRVLLVEDNLVNQEVAAKMLAKIGCSYDTVSNGEDALAVLNEQKYDLILMDLQMPRMDGFEATVKLKTESSYNLNTDTPVVALTAHATKEHQERCFDVGMADYLTKPLRLNDLRRVFQKWMPVHGEPARAVQAETSR